MQLPLVHSLRQVVSVPVSSAAQVKDPRAAHYSSAEQLDEQTRAHFEIPLVHSTPGVTRIVVPDEIAAAMTKARADRNS